MAPRGTGAERKIPTYTPDFYRTESLQEAKNAAKKSARMSSFGWYVVCILACFLGARKSPFVPVSGEFHPKNTLSTQRRKQKLARNSVLLFRTDEAHISGFVSPFYVGWCCSCLCFLWFFGRISPKTTFWVLVTLCKG